MFLFEMRLFLAMAQLGLLMAITTLEVHNTTTFMAGVFLRLENIVIGGLGGQGVEFCFPTPVGAGP